MSKKESKVIEFEGVKYSVLAPTVGGIGEADLEYSKAYTKALLGGLLPRVSTEKKIVELGLWSEQDDIDISIASMSIQDIVVRLNSETDNEKRRAIKAEFQASKNKFIELTSRKQSLLMHTAESKGEEAKIASMLWKCVTKEDGSKVWNSYQEFMNEKNSTLVGALAQEFVGFISGIDEKMEDIQKMLEDKEEPEVEVAVEEKKEEVAVAVA